MPDLSDQITDLASNPASTAGDGQSLTEQPLPALIQADQYLAAKAAAGNRSRGLRYGRFVLGGQVQGTTGTGGGFDRL